MFGGTLWAGGIGIDDHSDREREPPARPIEPEFPTYIPPFSPRRLVPSASILARDRLCHVRSFTEISDEDLALFNIKFENSVQLSSLLPDAAFSSRPFLYDDDLDAMLTEISTDNQDAFREILRMDPLPGRTKPRLAYARNFFGSLEDMARYWDSSSDQYYEVSASSNDAKPSKGNTSVTGKPNVPVQSSSTPATARDDTDMQDVPATSTDRVAMKEVYKGYRFGNGEQLNAGTRVAMVKNLLKMVTHKFTCRDHEPIPAPREKLLIRGVRIQSVQYQFCVAKIPKDVKLARSRMVEGPLMAALCREETRFKQTPMIVSAESALTGTTTLEGTGGQHLPTKPVKGKSPPSPSGFVGERFDLFREVGCMLILATQRDREHKSKSAYSGSDRWWVTQKRWGGGPLRWGNLACEIFEDEDPSWSPEERKLQEEKRRQEAEDKTKSKDASDILGEAKVTIDSMMAANAPLLPSLPGDPLAGPRKKKLRSLDKPPGKEDETRDGRRLAYMPPFRKKWYQDWQKLRPNTPMWDDKIIYKHIGKRSGCEFDDIFMITSVNHHIALLRMKVHPKYLAWLETGEEVPDHEVEGLRKDVLYVQRSGWFDMFSIDARREMLIALWQLMCWLNRDLVDQAEFDKMEEKKSHARTLETLSTK